MGFNQAITRRPGQEMGRGITTSSLGPPDHARALAQFDAYVAALETCGMTVTVLDPLEGYPDAHFVEDTAVVTPEVAVITRPGAEARRGEVDTIAAALQPLRKTERIQPPGTLDGGDVLIIDRRVLIGLSQRTNRHGAEQLGAILARYAYTWTPVPVAAGLHFKSSVNAVRSDTLVVTPELADHPALADWRRLVIAGADAYAANTLLVNDHLLMPTGFPAVHGMLAQLGMPILELDTSEFRKMDGGLTCLSLRF